MAYTSEEKLKILYEDSLKDIKDLTQRLEAAAKIIGTTNTSINANKSAIEAGVGIVVKQVLFSENGPLKKLNDLYSSTNILFAGFFCGLAGGVAGGIVVGIAVMKLFL